MAPAVPCSNFSTLVELFKDERLELRKVIQKSIMAVVAVCQEMAVEQCVMDYQMAGMS